LAVLADRAVRLNSAVQADGARPGSTADWDGRRFCHEQAPSGAGRHKGNPTTKRTLDCRLDVGLGRGVAEARDAVFWKGLLQVVRDVDDELERGRVIDIGVALGVAPIIGAEYAGHVRGTVGSEHVGIEAEQLLGGVPARRHRQQNRVARQDRVRRHVALVRELPDKSGAMRCRPVDGVEAPGNGLIGRRCDDRALSVHLQILGYRLVVWLVGGDGEGVPELRVTCCVSETGVSVPVGLGRIQLVGGDDEVHVVARQQHPGQATTEPRSRHAAMGRPARGRIVGVVCQTEVGSGPVAGVGGDGKGLEVEEPGPTVRNPEDSLSSGGSAEDGAKVVAADEPSDDLTFAGLPFER